MTPEQMQAWRWERELDERNRPLSDDELDALFPQEGYKVNIWPQVVTVLAGIHVCIYHAEFKETAECFDNEITRACTLVG